MKKLAQAVSLFALSSFSIIGCGSDDAGASNDAGTGGAAGTGGQAAAGSIGHAGAAGAHAGSGGASGAGNGGKGGAGNGGKGGASTGGAAGSLGGGGKGGAATGGKGGDGGSPGGNGGAATGGATQQGAGGAPVGQGGNAGGGAQGGDAGAGGDAVGGGSTGGSGQGGAGGQSSALPAGWLYTSGSKILVSDGNGSGSPWMGRGVNTDDIYLCGYNYTLWMQDSEQTLTTMMSGLLTDWKPTFVRVSLGMGSYPTVSSWLGDPTTYKTPMTNVIQSMGKTPGTYVLVALRSDASMILQDTADGDAEATGIPSDATTTPDAGKFPTGTDATYQALVDTFASSSFVVFGLTNEPGGNKRSNETISAAMSHAVGVIRAEEDKLGVPHHLVSVQGNGWTSDISFYAASPLPYDNVVYEVHGYPPSVESYTYANIPVILGEYGSLPDAASFYADVEAKQIPNLAWDFESYSNCSPDLLQVNQSATNLMPTAWGSTVKDYLLAH